MKNENKKKWAKRLKVIEENKNIIYGFLGGLLIGLLIMVATRPKPIANLEDGTQPVVVLNGTNITADQLYEDMKDYYSVSILLEEIDKTILTDKYPSDDEMESSIASTYSQYESYYGDQLESQLQQNGIGSIDEFKEMLRLEYRRNKAVEDYLKENMSEDEIKKYYDDEVYGDINSKHMLVKPDTDDNMSDEEKTTKKEEALKLAKEIIAKLDEGANFDDVAEEYKDSITFETIGLHAYDASLEEPYKKAEKELDVDTYTKIPVETSYGYHVIYKIEQKDKAELSTVHDNIASSLASEKLSADTNLSYNTLFKIREEAGLEFKDEVLKEKYDVYMKNYE